MIDAATTFVVVLFLALLAWALSRTYPRALRLWIWGAFVEYMGCAIFQYLNGADANGYREAGMELAKLLDTSFSWGVHEMLLLLFQQPSALDDVVFGAGTNSGSMCAVSGFILFLVRGSPWAAQALVAGLAMFGALGVFNASRDAAPESSPQRLFVATVLFPSVAFWTSALHKEAFCLMGTGLLLSGWRAAHKLRVRALLYFPLGVALIVMFRAPALLPILLGLVLFFVIDRIRRSRRAEATIVGPLYIGIGLGVLALGMVLVSRVSPNLSIDQLGETVTVQQRSWSAVEAGGSSFDVDAPVAQTLGAQLALAPLALMNALLRPQLFDVTSPLVLVGALEMTAITWILFRAVRLHGIRGLFVRIQSSPFLVLCVVATVVGCTFIGLTTRNFGSMARYRVPFLPFYGAMLAMLSEKMSNAATPKAPKAAATPRRRTRQRPVIPARQPELQAYDAQGKASS